MLPRAMPRLARSFVLLLASGLAASACGRADAAPADAEAPPVPVEVATVGDRTSATPLLVTGVIGAKEEIPLSFKIGGIVARVAADVGDRVRAGQVLAELADAEIGAAVAKAEQARDKARRDLARAEQLYADSVVTRTQLDDARTGLAVAEADLRAASFNRRFATVTAPADGVILRRDAEASQLVSPGQAVLVLRTDREGTVLRAGVADRDVARLRVGDAASVRSAARPDTALAARVVRIAAAASPVTGAYEVELAVTGGAAGWPSGLVAEAAIIPARRDAGLAVPLRALIEADGDSAAVFVLPEQATRVVRRAVRLGALDGDAVFVRAGLTAGERVVVTGAPYLADGSRVVLRAAEVAP